MTRRALFGMLAAAAATDPERLLWQPGRKLISIPKLLAVVPPCPFSVTANFRNDDRTAACLNGILRFKWRNEPEFRDEYHRRLAAHVNAPAWEPRESLYDIQRDVLRTLRREHELETRVTVGRGYWRNLNP